MPSEQGTGPTVYGGGGLSGPRGYGGQGGGLSGLFTGTSTMTFDSAGQTRSVIIAAGGGGGGCQQNNGGAGGGTVGLDGSGSGSGTTYYGHGGTQSAGGAPSYTNNINCAYGSGNCNEPAGSALRGSSPGTAGDNGGSGGGGGGYYGGSSGWNGDTPPGNSGGGGGSSYVTGTGITIAGSGQTPGNASDPDVIQGGTVTGNAIFNDSTQNNATVLGACSFYDASLNNGSCGLTQYFKPFYFNNATSSHWADLANWWYDPSFTIHAPTVPTTGDTVYIGASLTQGSTLPIILNKLYIAASTTNPSGATFAVNLNNISANDFYFYSKTYSTSAINGNLHLFGTSSLSSVDRGTLNASSTVEFNESSYNNTILPVTNNAIFNGSSYNAASGTVLGSAIFNNSSHNAGNLFSPIFNNGSYNSGTSTGSTTFNDSSSNIGIVVGTSTFNGTSGNGGTTTNAIFNGGSANAIAGLSSLSSGIVAYWKMDETTGTRVDSSGNGYNLNPQGSVSYDTGVINNSVFFNNNGSNSAQLQTNNPIFTSMPAQGVTLSAWIKWSNNLDPNNCQSGRVFGDWYVEGMSFSTWPNIIPSLGNTCQFLFGIGNNFTIGFVPVVGQWYHIVGTYNTSNNLATLWVNGVEVSSGNPPNTSPNNGFWGPWTVGYSYYYGNGQKFTGDLDEAGIWNRPLTNTEIAFLYNNGAARHYPFTSTPHVGVVLSSATFVGDLSENILEGLSGIVNGVKTRVYNTLNPQLNSVRNFVTDGPWTIIANNVFVDLTHAVVDLFNLASPTHTTLITQGSGFILAPLDPSKPVTSCGILASSTTYTMASSSNISFAYGTCFKIAADNVTLNGNGSVITATASSSVGINAVASSTLDSRFNAYTNLTIKNIKFVNFAHGIVGTGDDNIGSTAGNGASTTIIHSILADVNVSGGDPTDVAGSGGNITFISSTSTGALASLGGDSTACGIPGNGGNISVSPDSYFATTTNSGGSVRGCQSGSTPAPGSSGGTTSAPPSPDPNPFQPTNPTTPTPPPSTTVPVVSGGSSYKASTSTYGYIPDINPLSKLILPNIPTFTPDINAGNLGTTNLGNPLAGLQSPGQLNFKSIPVSFSLPIANFVFSPLPKSIATTFKNAPNLGAFLGVNAITSVQDLVNLKLNPAELPISNNYPAGLFLVSASSTPLKLFVSTDSGQDIVELVKVSEGSKLTVTFTPISKGKVKATFLGKTVDFVTNGVRATASLTAPTKPGSYLLTTTSSPISLEIQVLSGKTALVTTSPVPTTSSKPTSTSFWSMILSFVHKLF